MSDLRADLVNYLRQLSEEEPVLILDRSLSPLNLTENDRRRDELKELELKVSTCTRCELAATRLNVVFGVGDPHARLMFIGEAPGADEDRQGEPFVGRAGKLLTKMIRAMKMQRSEVYIANILKCRPPGNRDPRPEEAAACLPYLKGQIDLIKPHVIVALGKVAAVKLLNIQANVSLKSLRGRVFNYDTRPLIVTYHPAAL
ncbi:MAG TPA: uracil-DNA glycosylase, partial [Bacteroidetes bacterium]|nr:uracil-DNA glycosylase [Bacteroidota bacterium]